MSPRAPLARTFSQHQHCDSAAPSSGVRARAEFVDKDEDALVGSLHHSFQILEVPRIRG